MTPDKQKELLLLLLERGYEVFIPICPSPLFVIRRYGQPPAVCLPVSAYSSPTGPRCSVKPDFSAFSFDYLLVFLHETCELWLVPFLTIPPGGNLTLGASYNLYRLPLHEEGQVSTEELEKDLQSFLKENQNAS